MGNTYSSHVDSRCGKLTIYLLPGTFHEMSPNLSEIVAQNQSDLEVQTIKLSASDILKSFLLFEAIKGKLLYS